MSRMDSVTLIDREDLEKELKESIIDEETADLIEMIDSAVKERYSDNDCVIIKLDKMPRKVVQRAVIDFCKPKFWQCWFPEDEPNTLRVGPGSDYNARFEAQKKR